MSNLSDLLPAGASAKSITATDSGSGITSGKPVILETAGTVTQVALVAASDVGTPVVFEPASSAYFSATFDSNSNKVVIAYKDTANSSYGTAVVGTVSGTAISYGTPVVYVSSAVIAVSSTFDSDSNKVVIAYNSTYGYGIVGTVSGTAISFGTAAVLNSASSNWLSATFDSSSNKVVIAYQDLGNSYYGTAIVGTVSGTSISFGSEVVFETASTNYISATFDSNSNKTVIAYTDGGNSFHGTGIVGTVSGTAISFGTPVVFEAADTGWISATFDSDSNKVVIAYKDGGNSDYGTSVVGTVSGTAISFGTAVIFETASTNNIGATFDSNSNKVVIAYSDGGNSLYGTVIQGTVSGTSISYGSTVVFESANVYQVTATFDSGSNKVVIAYQDGLNSYYGTGVVYSTSTTNLTATNFLGIADETISSSASGVIVVQGGTSAKLTSLTIASNYYVQPGGTFGTSASTPSVKAGLAISTTALLLSGDS